ncbi:MULTISPECIES: hypothetical protein [unclassified Nocardioides]|uniref:hypothetical protein n=1 Tax=unclassified Nocardioides TaxID=2615069 RepID=UPI000703B75D|nr:MULTISPECIES: hypothetical protein [unclassified Nocardioides]KQP66864.1 hypothetical protein ASF47_03910 [Nocardioides sp. Leaf285]KQQ41433.1 hypothetical protein ASF50_10470 [Nocardioides sp. Leaf307]
MSTEDLCGGVAVLDESVLGELALDLCPASALTFARTYRRMLPGRVTRVTSVLAPPAAAATEAADVDVLDAVLSLGTSAAAVGACCLAEVAQGLARDVRRGDREAARCRLARLRAVTGCTERALDGYLARS